MIERNNVITQLDWHGYEPNNMRYEILGEHDLIADGRKGTYQIGFGWDDFALYVYLGLNAVRLIGRAAERSELQQLAQRIENGEAEL